MLYKFLSDFLVFVAAVILIRGFFRTGRRMVNANNTSPANTNENAASSQPAPKISPWEYIIGPLIFWSMVSWFAIIFVAVRCNLIHY
jgi:hypothetical protein